MVTTIENIGEKSSSDAVVLWHVPYGILNRNKTSNGVNDLFQEGKPYIENKGFKIISVAPKVGDNSNNVADYNLGNTLAIPKWLARIIGTNLPLTLPYNKQEARSLILEVKPRFLVLDEPTAGLGFGAHGLISGVPRREDGKPIPVIGSRHHAGKYSKLADALYYFLLRVGKEIKRPQFTTYGVPNGRLTAGLVNTLFKDLDFRIAVSYATAEAFKKRLNDGAEYKIIYNGINTEELTPEGPIIEEWKEEDKDIILCAPGRFDPRKGISYFVQAAPIIKREKPNTLFVLAGGDESDRKPYESMVDSMGIRGYFRFAERLPLKRYPDALRTPRLCICPPIGGEGFGRIVVEPLACGTPVVASNIDGYNEATEGGQPFALMSEPKNPNGIAKKAIEILNWSAETREKMKWEAALYVRKRFAWSIIATQIAALLNDSYNGHGGVDWSKLPRSGTIYRRK